LAMDRFRSRYFYFQYLGWGLILAAGLGLVGCKKSNPAPKPETAHLPIVEPIPTNAAPAVVSTPVAPTVVPVTNNTPVSGTPAPVVAVASQAETNQPPQVLPVPSPTPQPTRPPTPFATGGSLRVLALPGHFPDWLKASLEEKLRTKIEVQTYATPEEAETDLAAPNAHFDLALIADRIVPGLIQAKALRPLPVTLGVKPDHLYLGHDHIDRDNRFAWPYAWSLVELAYNSTVVHNPPNSIDLKGLEKKGQSWVALKPLSVWNPEAFVPDTESNGGVHFDGTPYYHVDGYGVLRRALSGQSCWKYILPKEGSIILLYHLTLPENGTNPAMADAAVALFMDPANTARLASENGMAVTQKEAFALVSPELAHDPLLYPPFAVMSRSSFAKP